MAHSPLRIGRPLSLHSAGETVRAYLPRPLPTEPPVALDRMLGLLERANQALGRLDGVTSLLPSTALYIFMYVRKEALLSR